MADEPALVKAMSDALVTRMPLIAQSMSYYRGDHRIAFATSKWRDTFGMLFNELSDNWSQIVVDCAVERLKVEGFRFGPGDDTADDEAWQLWQENYLDADSIVAHTQACMTGITYLLVTPTDNPDVPRISVESPEQVITFNDPRDRRKRLAGLKTWLDEDGIGRAVLYMPDHFVMYMRPKRARTWVLDGEPVVNPIGVVPVVPMLNNPNVLGDGMSDLTVMVSLQDAINKLLADLLVNSEYVAFPQRYVTGLNLPIDPETGKVYDRTKFAQLFLSGVNRVWVAEPNPKTGNNDVQFGSLPSENGAGYVAQIEMLVQHIAAQTRTPPHYLTAGLGQWPSGDSLKASEAGLVAKVHRKQITFGEAWEEALRLAFAYRGDDARAHASQVETIWADPEQRSEGQLVDALIKMSTLGARRRATATVGCIAARTGAVEGRGASAVPDAAADASTNTDNARRLGRDDRSHGCRRRDASIGRDARSHVRHRHRRRRDARIGTAR
jgi:hypothetical protein